MSGHGSIPGRQALVVLALAIGAFSVLSCSPPGYSGEAASIRFAAIPSGSATLVYIAQEQGFFAANGLDVEVADYDTGVATTGALLQGEVDVAWSAELQVVRRALAKEKLSIIAGLSKFSDEYLYARKDQGIEKPADLKGKKIGLPRNTIAEFYLTRFLTLNGMSLQDVSLFDVLPQQSIAAISSDNFDGVVTWEPFSTQIKTEMAAEVVSWSVQSSQPGYGVITGRNDWISENPELVDRFLKSLVQAEDFLRRNPQAARDIVQKQLGFDEALMDIIWNADEFALSLEQSLIVAMEDEARWIISNNPGSEKQMPNFLDYVSEDVLKKIKPEAVNMLRWEKL